MEKSEKPKVTSCMLHVHRLLTLLNLLNSPTKNLFNYIIGIHSAVAWFQVFRFLLLTQTQKTLWLTKNSLNFITQKGSLNHIWQQYCRVVCYPPSSWFFSLAFQDQGITYALNHRMLCHWLWECQGCKVHCKLQLYQGREAACQYNWDYINRRREKYMRIQQVLSAHLCFDPRF